MIHTTQPESNMTKLKDLCRMRWIECIDALDQVKYLHSSIVVCFESISAEDSHKWSPDSLTDASTLLLAITTTDFISTLVITNECLHYFLGLTRSLQQEAKDIVQAVSEVEVLTSSLKEVRENVDSHHSEWFKTISDMCSKVGTTPSIPRICGYQHHRPNTPASTPFEYFRRTITVPILDYLLAELNRRFTSHQITALQGLYLVPSVLVTKDLSSVSKMIMETGEFYAVDLPNVSSLKSEIHNWYTKWKLKKRTTVHLHFLLLSPQHYLESLDSIQISKHL